jgi:hypothetical protein
MQMAFDCSDRHFKREPDFVDRQLLDVAQQDDAPLVFSKLRNRFEHLITLLSDRKRIVRWRSRIADQICVVQWHGLLLALAPSPLLNVPGRGKHVRSKLSVPAAHLPNRTHELRKRLGRQLFGRMMIAQVAEKEPIKRPFESPDKHLKRSRLATLQLLDKRLVQLHPALSLAAKTSRVSIHTEEVPSG